LQNRVLLNDLNDVAAGRLALRPVLAVSGIGAPSETV
jgi:hypothetical protein